MPAAINPAPPPTPTLITARRCAAAASLTTASVAGLWAALHLFPAFGPAVADGVRSFVGPGPVAWAEDFVYGVEDRIKGVVYHDAPPKTFWEAPTAAPDEPAPASLPIASMEPVAPTFAPSPFAPPIPGVAAAGDGQWLAVPDPGAPNDPPRMYKTAVHPDARRRYAAVAVVAVDLDRLDLSLVAGTVEPVSEAVPRDRRPGLVPAARFDDLVAAFNGGFKVEHGHYGMMLDGQTLVPARETSCTVALYKDGSIRVRTWPAVASSVADMVGYRQTPPCLVEEGRVADPLLDASANAANAANANKSWGTAVGGETTIRRSALGLDRAGRTLFYAIGESVTAGSMARAMKAAGAENAAQLDVNGFFPRFVLYGRRKPNDLPQVTAGLIPELLFTRHEYVSKAEGRDFFYLTRKAP